MRPLLLYDSPLLNVIGKGNKKLYLTLLDFPTTVSIGKQRQKWRHASTCANIFFDQSHVGRWINLINLFEINKITCLIGKSKPKIIIFFIIYNIIENYLIEFYYSKSL